MIIFFFRFFSPLKVNSRYACARGMTQHDAIKEKLKPKQYKLIFNDFFSIFYFFKFGSGPGPGSI